MTDNPEEPNDLVPLGVVAAELRMITFRLTALSREGKFPALLKVTRKHYLVSRAAVEAWKAGRWTQPVGGPSVPLPTATATKARKPKARKSEGSR